MSIDDFHPLSTWKGDESYLHDQTSGRKYALESDDLVQYKCSILSLATPILHPIAQTVNNVYRTVKIACQAIELMRGEARQSSGAQLKEMSIDALRIMVSPVSWIALEAAALYGTLISPQDGKKLYASLERAIYGGPILAPSFQPDPEGYSWKALARTASEKAYNFITGGQLFADPAIKKY